MEIFKPNFKDFTFKDGHMSAKIRFSVFNRRAKKAQVWLDREIMTDMRPLIPIRTGVFRRTIESVNKIFEGTGRITTAVPPQGKWLYGGVTDSGKPIKYTNPLSVPKWGEVTIEKNREKYKQGVKDCLKGKQE